MARGGAQAQPAPLRQWSTRSKEHGRHGARPVRLASTAKGGSCWPPTPGTRPSSRPRALRAGDPGPGHAARGFRFRNAPRLLAASLSLKTPERIRARLMGMTVGLLLSAALESRIRKALQDHGATFPNQQGLPVQPPPHGGAFPSLWGFTCASSQGSSLWGCIAPRRISRGSNALEHLTNDSTAEDAEKCQRQCGMSAVDIHALQHQA